ncbi:MAG: hypothetical protein KQH53_11455 [Desulfarculaceae bacterium]|nr:hypothetical protein [Desulfarculaceae bacterium]
MEKHFRERYLLYRRLGAELAADLEVNHILEAVRSEAKRLIPGAMEACILLLDPEAGSYTRPLQCDLYDTPRNCLSCKRNRTAVQKALRQHKAVVLNQAGSVTRPDGGVISTGPEAATPIMVRGEPLAVGTVLIEPGARFTRREFFLMRDMADIAGNHLLAAKLHWEVTQEKLRIGQTLSSLTPFVPHAVRRLAEQEPEGLTGGKQWRQVSVLFVDIEGYSSLFSRMPEEEVSGLVESYFSSFVDPIQRSGGDINETAGDGLMIIFVDDDPAAGAKKAVEAAFDIQATAAANGRMLGDQAQPLRVNIGVNSGQALVGFSRFAGRSAARMTYTASGAVTNLAARLADLATGGDILISQTTHELTKHLWQAHPRGAHQFKGFDKPLEVWSLLRGEEPPLTSLS